MCSARINSQKEFSHVLSWAQALLCSVCAALHQAATARLHLQSNATVVGGASHVRAADVEFWERDAASVLDVLGSMEPAFCEVSFKMCQTMPNLTRIKIMAGVRSVSVCSTFNVPPILPLLATLCPALSHIQMHDCSMFSEAALARFLPSNRHLQRLHVEHAPGLLKDTVEGVLELCPSLVSLCIVDAPNLVLRSPSGTDTMFQLSVASSIITDLQLQRCPQVSPRWTEMLIKRMHRSVRAIRLTGCTADRELLQFISSRSAAKRIMHDAPATGHVSAILMPLRMLLPVDAARHCPLRILAIGGDTAVERMRDDDVGALVAGCIFLQQLSLTGMHAVGVATAFAISSLSQLQRLLLLDCRGVDDDFCITLTGALSSHLPIEADGSLPGMRTLRPVSYGSSSTLIELRISGAAISDVAPIILSHRHPLLMFLTVRAGAVHRNPCK